MKLCVLLFGSLKLNNIRRCQSNMLIKQKRQSMKGTYKHGKKMTKKCDNWVNICRLVEPMVSGNFVDAFVCARGLIRFRLS